MLKVLGLIVNPLAGIGGRVGLKGSDGEEIVRKALAMGAEPVSSFRALEALVPLSNLKDQLVFIAYAAEMGADQVLKAGITPVVLGNVQSGYTTSADTRRAAREMLNYPVDLLLFVGGDGTARDIYTEIADQIPVLGIPAGVKIHSGVFSVSPRRAADLIIEYMSGRAYIQEMEVMDIDEDRFRHGQVSARLYGYMKVPYQRRLLQGAKAASFGASDNLKPIAQAVVDSIEEDYYYILGPGTTIRAIGEELKIDKTLLGVDIIFRKQLIDKDVSETRILEKITGRPARIVVTVIGGQGYLFGRGNQQISPRVIRMVGKENIIIAAEKSKILALNGPLRVDTGDAACDEYLAGYVRIITGYQDETVWKIEV